METLIPLIPGTVTATSLVLAFMDVSSDEDGRSRVYWALLNLGLSIWTASYFIGTAYTAWTDFATTSQLAEFLFGMGQLGVAMTATYYFLFSAEASGLRSFTRGGWLFAVHVPGALIVLSCCVGPLERYFVTWTGSGAADFSYGPLGYALIVALYGLVLRGAMLQVAARYESRDDEFALPHGIFALAGLLPLAANLVWIARQPVGLEFAFNPTVVAFLAANLAMLISLKAWCKRTSMCSTDPDIAPAIQPASGA